MSSRNELFKKVSDPVPATPNKISIIGAGQVGTCVAFSLLTQAISNELCIIDVGKEKLMGELMDLQHGSVYLNNPNITASPDYASAAGSRICIITAGVRRKEGESRVSVVQRNADIMKDMIPKLVKSSPNTIIIMVSTPVEIMTYVAWKLSGLPKNRVMGIGTSLDTARFRFLISQRLGVSPTSCDGWIIGEQGENAVAVWSGVTIAGIRLSDVNSRVGAHDDSENWIDVQRQVSNASYEIVKQKGYETWSISLCVSSLCRSILYNMNSVFACSTSIMGEQGIEKDVFLSVPCVINANGISAIVKLKLAPSEKDQVKKSAQIMADLQAAIKV